MTREEIVAYARRDWAAVEASKRDFWARRKRSLTPLEALEIGDALRRGVRKLRPDWPSDAEREADVSCHERLSRRLASGR